MADDPDRAAVAGAGGAAGGAGAHAGRADADLRGDGGAGLPPRVAVGGRRGAAGHGAGVRAGGRHGDPGRPGARPSPWPSWPAAAPSTRAPRPGTAAPSPWRARSATGRRTPRRSWGWAACTSKRGNLPGARRFLVRSMRAAQRNSLHEHRRDGAARPVRRWRWRRGREREAQELARAAYEAYGPQSHWLPRLAQDVAYWWITQGYFARALPVLRSLLPHLPKPSDRLIVFCQHRARGGRRGRP